jgi:hypothetical protein
MVKGQAQWTSDEVWSCIEDLVDPDNRCPTYADFVEQRNNNNPGAKVWSEHTLKRYLRKKLVRIVRLMIDIQYSHLL